MKMKMSELGFLQVPLKGEFSGVSLSPVDDHAERLNSLKKDSNIDGYYYPPQIANYSTDPFTGEIKDKIERTDKPASVFFLPASHTIRVNNPIITDKEPCTDEALIIYLLAYIYGTRLQPCKWKFDGRVPIKPVNNIFISNETSLHFLEHVYNWWRKLTEIQRTKFVNILYVYTRANSLAWDWDAFLHQYMVFDALYNFHSELAPKQQKKPSHKERFNILCNAYSVSNEDLVTRIYAARNNLFHEAMWVESTIGFGSPDKDSHQLPYHLSRLNARIICGITGYLNKYTKSPWWVMGKSEFDKLK